MSNCGGGAVSRPQGWSGCFKSALLLFLVVYVWAYPLMAVSPSGPVLVHNQYCDGPRHLVASGSLNLCSDEIIYGLDYPLLAKVRRFHHPIGHAIDAKDHGDVALGTFSGTIEMAQRFDDYFLSIDLGGKSPNRRDRLGLIEADEYDLQALFVIAKFSEVFFSEVPKHGGEGLLRHSLEAVGYSNDASAFERGLSRQFVGVEPIVLFELPISSKENVSNLFDLTTQKRLTFPRTDIYADYTTVGPQDNDLIGSDNDDSGSASDDKPEK